VAGCVNGAPYYTNPDIPNRMFCYDVLQKYSIVHTDDMYYNYYGTDYYCWTWRTDTRYAYCGSSGVDVMNKCPNNMYVKGRSGRDSISRYSSVVASDCEDPNGFTFVDNACLQENDGYTHSLCLSDDAFDGGFAQLFDESTADFHVYSEVCKNGKPVYFYNVFEETDDVVIELDEDADFDEFVVDDELVEVGKRFFLHYSEEGNWVVSMNQISDIYKAICYEDNLLECTANAWSVLNETMVEYEKYIDANHTLYGIEYTSITEDIQMSVAQNECGYVAAQEQNGSGVGTTELVAIVAAIVFILVAVLFGVFVFRKKKMEKGVVGWDTKEKVADDEEEIEIEADIPMVTNM